MGSLYFWRNVQRDQFCHFFVLKRIHVDRYAGVQFLELGHVFYFQGEIQTLQILFAQVGSVVV